MSEMNNLKFVDVDTNILKEQAVKEKPRRMTRTPAVWMTLPSGGECRVRLLPPWTDQGQNAHKPYLRIFQHWDVGPDGKRVICPRKMSEGAKSCYVCEQIDLLYGTGDERDAKRAQRMRAGQSFIYQVIERGDEVWTEADEAVAEDPSLLGQPKIKFFRLPWAGHKQVLDYYNDPNYGNLSHPLYGIDIIVTREGSGLDTQYGVKCVILNGMLHKAPAFGTAETPDSDKIHAVLEDLYDMDEHPFFRVNEYDETKALYMGQDPDEGRAALPESTSQRPAKGGMLLSAPQSVPDVLKAWSDYSKQFAPMSRAEAALWGSAEFNQHWEEHQIPECYGDEPDHEDDGCQACPVRGPCSSLYFSKNNSYSQSASAPTPPPSAPMLLGGKGSRNSASATAPLSASGNTVPLSAPPRNEGVDDMVAFLEEQSKG